MATEVEVPLASLGNFSPEYAGDRLFDEETGISSRTGSPSNFNSSPLTGHLEPIRRSSPRFQGSQGSQGSQDLDSQGTHVTQSSQGYQGTQGTQGTRSPQNSFRGARDEETTGLSSPQYPQTPLSQQKHLPTPRRTPGTRLPSSLSPRPTPGELDSPPLGSILQTSPDRTPRRIHGQPVDLSRLPGSLPSLSVRPSYESRGSLINESRGSLINEGVRGSLINEGPRVRDTRSSRSFRDDIQDYQETQDFQSTRRTHSTQERLHGSQGLRGSQGRDPILMSSSIPSQTYSPSLTQDHHTPRRNSPHIPSRTTRTTRATRQEQVGLNSPVGMKIAPLFEFIASLPDDHQGQTTYEPAVPLSPSFRVQPPPPQVQPPVQTQVAPVTQAVEPEVALPLTPEQIQEIKVRDAKTRADYRVKFSILREAYPQMNIPEPAEDKSLPEIDAEYKAYVRRIIIDSSVEQNKTYLLILWLVIELIGTRLMRLPFDHYVKNQLKYMDKYQMLLIELGESAAMAGTGSGWPVEVRIIAMALFNGLIFVMVKMLADKIGVGAGETAEEFTQVIADFLTKNRGQDVLRRASQATADDPGPPPAAPATPPMGNMGGMVANLIGALSSGGLNNLGSILGAATGGGTGEAAKPAEAPRVRRPTFASRRRRNQEAVPED